MRGDPDSCGIWAPCLTHADGRFWLIYTDVKRYGRESAGVSGASLRDFHNYLVTCDTIEGEWSAMGDEAAGLQTALWDDALRAAELVPNPVTSGLFIQALNDMIDSFGRRDAALNRHVPEIVLWLLFGTFLISGLIVGFAAGGGGRRPSWVTYAMTVLILVLVFVRPRRGLIKVSEKSMLDLQASIKGSSSAPGAASPASGVGR